MSSAFETQTTLTGLFKDVYEDKIVNLSSEASVLQKRIKFVENDKREGRLLHQPVLLALPTGMTFGVGAVALNNPVASTMGDAQIAGAGMTLADRITYDVAAKAASGGVRAFVEATELIVDALTQSMSKFIEIELLWGSSNHGTLGQTTVHTGAGTVGTLVIDTAEWSAGIWSGMENINIDAYNAGVLVNTNAALVVTAVNVATLTITVSGNAADITAINGLNGTALQLFPYLAFGQEMQGFYNILSNVSTIFNINAATYALWQSNVYDVLSTALNFGKVQSAIAQATARGLMEDITVFVNPTTYSNLITSQAGARRYDSSYKKSELENGTESLCFYGPNGKIEIVGHIFMKQGYAFALPLKRCQRTGATDLTFTLPGMPGEFFLQLPGFTAYELRCYTLQAAFLNSPAKAVLLKNIVNQ
jgi:formaldehyde-activating enzyme involved in methanogenesis